MITMVLEFRMKLNTKNNGERQKITMKKKQKTETMTTSCSKVGSRIIKEIKQKHICTHTEKIVWILFIFKEAIFVQDRSFTDNIIVVFIP